MIGRLRGVIIEKQPPEVLLEAGGVGYEVCMPMTCFYELAQPGTEVTLFTHLVVREDAQLLYGFNHKQERTLFRELIKVNGIGPKLALGILSGMSAQEFVHAIESESISLLVKLPGVGKKTAERLIVEMKDRFKGIKGELFSSVSSRIAIGATSVLAEETAENDAVSALIALGYRPQDASRLISKVIKPGVNSEDLIREALRAAL